MSALGAEEPVSLVRPSLKIFTSRFAAVAPLRRHPGSPELRL